MGQQRADSPSSGVCSVDEAAGALEGPLGRVRPDVALEAALPAVLEAEEAVFPWQRPTEAA